jgi:hypothetical protein
VTEGLIKELGQYGLLGILLAIAMLVIWYKDRQNEKLHDEKDALHDKITEMVKETTTANQQLSISLQLLTEKITKGRQ